MVQGCFSGTLGRSGLYFLPKNITMNGEHNQTVLENQQIRFPIAPWLHTLSGGQCTVQRLLADQGFPG
jgi:hypothetical protein